jgi:diphthine synthase
MLKLIGLGLFDERDLSLRAIEEAKSASKAYIELYTTAWFGSMKNLGELIGKKIEILKRKDLEENSAKILNEAKEKDVVIFVGGDPLIATTHSSLILEARKQNIGTKIIHNSSIVSATAETGLHIYKFGPSVTIPFLEKTKGKLPESVYDVIKINKARGLHTLCLLDIDAEEEKLMSVREAIEILFSLEEARKEGVISPEEKAVVFSRAGSNKPNIFFEKLKSLFEKEIESPAVIIIPGLLHFTEKEFLEAISSSLPC